MNEVYADSGLGKWFGGGKKGGAGGGGWDRYNTKGERIGKCGDKSDKEGKPKCLSKEKAAKMSKKERANAVKRKRRKDSDTDRPGTGNKPINVSNNIDKKKKKNEGMYEMKVDAPKGYHWMKDGKGYKLMKNPAGGFVPHKGGSEKADFELQKVHNESRNVLSFSQFLLAEKNVPNDPGKWAASKAAAKAKFDVYPSAYANAWASKNYKSKGGTWRKEKKKK